ncbi:hypothetical protein AB0A69_04460 [Streptomyces sp. NPDC045431]|uniref:hypothetical protein n=1 Tax=Streptomyces sp. NPDC045431 TaxID=3155613 RepID=UPI0033C27708
MSVPSDLAGRHAPTSQQDTSAPRRARRRRAASSETPRRTPLPARFLGYVGYYVGAGLISGAVVHHPMDPARYSLIAGYGVLVFLAATALNEFVLTRERPGLPQVLKVITTSTVLSFGLGMLSGGLQHFADVPERSATLIPLGIVLAYVAYTLKEEPAPWRRIFGPVGLAVLVVAALSFVGLRHIASTMPESGHHGGVTTEHDGREGQDSSPGSRPTELNPPAEGAPSDSPPTPAAPSKDVHGDEQPGHEDSHHH